MTKGVILQAAREVSQNQVGLVYGDGKSDPPPALSGNLCRQGNIDGQISVAVLLAPILQCQPTWMIKKMNVPGPGYSVFSFVCISSGCSNASLARKRQ
jgi:hypothetical protein